MLPNIVNSSRNTSDSATGTTIRSRAAADRDRHRVLHVGDVQTVAGGLAAIDRYRQHRQAGGLFDLGLRGALDVTSEPKTVTPVAVVNLGERVSVFA